ncbi:hypothetical protein B0I35DRAFT_405951 [Stachybotrys elegans]|uniref:Uncharacterized protein n=1 Tax=Stachybotrys elegans TaxID=80388 RepID=A0A8K0WVK0_9HYPO|nr:hypothetical protein B0I35DRAFT_405951 [Stachybotrys elegans]
MSGPPGDADEEKHQPPGLYRLVMTPLNFVTFLVSLVLVDMRFTTMRYHTHSEAQSRLPAWLHGMLFRNNPYQTYDGGGQPRQESWHYHSNQKKLMRMEADEAFRMRSSVLVIMAVAAATAVGFVGYALNRLVGSLFYLLRH